MLHSITSTLPTFATVEFRPGMNFIIADGALQRDGKGTANSVGKSSVFFLIDFLLGGNVGAKDFNSDKFQDESFTLSATLAGRKVSITRAAHGKERTSVVVFGDLHGWPELTEAQVEQAKEDGARLKVTTWRRILGKILFDLPDTLPGAVAKKPTLPTARELLSFFNRKAFNDVVKTFATQSEEKGNLICTYLMGLNWEYLASMIGLKKEDAVVKSIRTTADFELEGLKRTHADILGNVKELEKKVKKAEDELSKYRAKEEISLFLGRTDEVTAKLRSAQRDAFNASRRISLARKSLEGMNENPDELIAFYMAAKAELGEAVKRSLSETKSFHDKIRDYRESILKKEISFYEAELAKANDAIGKLDAEREECIQSDLVRDTFADFNEKQTQLSALRRFLFEVQQAQRLYEDAKREAGRLNTVRTKLAQSEKELFSNFKDEINGFSSEFVQAMKDLYGERDAEADFDVTFYDGTIAVGKNKPFTMKVKATVQGDRGPGKAHAKVCAFDIILFELSRKLLRRYDFLLHDSLAFENSDGNQFPILMKMAAKMAMRSDSQYVCAIDRERLRIACGKDKELEALVENAHKILLSQSRKLYGFDF